MPSISTLACHEMAALQPSKGEASGQDLMKAKSSFEFGDIHDSLRGAHDSTKPFPPSRFAVIHADALSRSLCILL